MQGRAAAAGDYYGVLAGQSGQKPRLHPAKSLLSILCKNLRNFFARFCL